MPCRLCGAEGTNKSTCPFNKLSSPNPSKHNSKPLITDTEEPLVPAHVSASLPVSGASLPVSGASLPIVPSTKYKYTKEELQDMEADFLRLSLPSVPVIFKPINDNIGIQCAHCYNYIKVGAVGSKQQESDFYQNMANYCHNCANLIAAQYQTDVKNTINRYKTYHSGSTVDLKTILTHGNKDGYYNNTMHKGAKFWSTVGDRRKAQR